MSISKRVQTESTIFPVAHPDGEYEAPVYMSQISELPLVKGIDELASRGVVRSSICGARAEVRGLGTRPGLASRRNVAMDTWVDAGSGDERR